MGDEAQTLVERMVDSGERLEVVTDTIEALQITEPAKEELRIWASAWRASQPAATQTRELEASR